MSIDTLFIDFIELLPINNLNNTINNTMNGETAKLDILLIYITHIEKKPKQNKKAKTKIVNNDEYQ